LLGGAFPVRCLSPVTFVIARKAARHSRARPDCGRINRNSDFDNDGKQDGVSAQRRRHLSLNSAALAPVSSASGGMAHSAQAAVERPFLSRSQFFRSSICCAFQQAMAGRRSL
jgi:hypothetical protein